MEERMALWDLNPRPFGPEPKSGALDHSAKLSLDVSRPVPVRGAQ
ncbi:Glycogen synthase [Corchorus olitorius]|uniref:Glycogen synthase n=1 Tax=Corchorus olitorius TaxID=93759 RepID=A0A1R3H3D7_9ROSI|nr:Glycogen synthase [Corchorus olitorius]